MCVFVCLVSNKVLGEYNTIENAYIFLSAVFIKKVNNFNKTWLKHIEYAESEFRSFEFIKCRFIVVYMQNTGILINYSLINPGMSRE